MLVNVTGDSVDGRAGVLSKHGAWLALLAVSASIQAQQRPDAGTVQEPQRQIPALPPAGAPRIVLPPPPSISLAPASTVRITPLAFRVEGNTAFSSGELLALLQPRAGRATDLAGLQEAARDLRKHYFDRGYLLTDTYLPEQALPAEGGTITIAIVEARVGKISVRVQGAGVSQTTAEKLLASQLKPGDLITEYALDKPVLLLRDLAGYDASAAVQPGALRGEADIIVTVKAQGTPLEASVGVDNHGTRAAGAIRAFADLQANNLRSQGDQFNGRIQLGEVSATRLYRLSYTLSAGNNGTRVSLAATRTEYALGKQFAALGATGQATVTGLSALHPLIRARNRNLFGSLALEHKQLDDQLAVAPSTGRNIKSLRLGVLGNFVDDVVGAGAFTNFAFNVTRGRLQLDPATYAADQATGGLRASGAFGKANLEIQRAQFFSGPVSLNGTLQAQFASKNLASAEKMSLGGPTGVRGYPVGEAVGDAGYIVSIESRYQAPAGWSLAGEPLSLTAFYDTGSVRFNQNGATVAGNSNGSHRSSVGVGVLAGRPGNFLLNTALAWRTDNELPTTGDPDRRPRVWLSAQKWF